MSIYLTKTELDPKTKLGRRDAKKGGFMKFLSRAFRRWEEHRSVAALQQLDDWMLYDIGLTRQDIPKSVAAWRKQRQAALVPQDVARPVAAPQTTHRRAA